MEALKARLCVLAQSFEQVFDMRTDAAQLFFVRAGKLCQGALAAVRQREANLPAVIRFVPALYPTFGNQTIHQSNGALMANLKALGQFADCYAGWSRKSLDGQQCLMLLWLDACLLCRFLAEVQKLAE